MKKQSFDKDASSKDQNIVQQENQNEPQNHSQYNHSQHIVSSDQIQDYAHFFTLLDCFKQKSPSQQPQIVQNSRQNSQISNQKFKNIVSGLTDSCLQTLRRNGFTIDQNLLERKLKQNNKKIPLRVQVLKHTPSWEIVELYCHMGSFQKKLIVLNKNTKCDFHQYEKINDTGEFGNIYKFQIKNTSFAIKCMKFDPKKPNTEKIIEIIKQILIAKMMSVLQIGPKFQTINGFDFVYRQNCIEFSMEHCLTHNYNSDYDGQLRLSLLKMHSLNICHRDIKTLNIMYSQVYNKHVFIDFGLSSLFQSNIGIRTKTRFIGNFEYIFKEMPKSGLKKIAFVDMYSNDKHNLQGAINIINQKKSKLKKEEVFEVRKESRAQNVGANTDELPKRYKQLLKGFWDFFKEIKSSINLDFITYKEQQELEQNEIEELNEKTQNYYYDKNKKLLQKYYFLIQTIKFILYYRNTHCGEENQFSAEDQLSFSKIIQSIKGYKLLRQLERFRRGLDVVSLDWELYLDKCNIQSNQTFFTNKHPHLSKSFQLYYNKQTSIVYFARYQNLQIDLRDKIQPTTLKDYFAHEFTHQYVQELLDKDKVREEYLKPNKIEEYILKVFFSVSIIRTQSYHSNFLKLCNKPPNKQIDFPDNQKKSFDLDQIIKQAMVRNKVPSKIETNKLTLFTNQICDKFIQIITQIRSQYILLPENHLLQTLNQFINPNFTKQFQPPIFQMDNGDQHLRHFLQSLLHLILQSNYHNQVQKIYVKKFQWIMPYGFEILKNLIISRHNFYPFIQQYMQKIIQYFIFCKSKDQYDKNLILIFVKQSIEVGFLTNYVYTPILKKQTYGYFPSLYLNQNLLVLNQFSQQNMSKLNLNENLEKKLKIIQKLWIFYNYESAKINLSDFQLSYIFLKIRQGLRDELEALSKEQRLRMIAVYGQAMEVLRQCELMEFIDKERLVRRCSVRFANQNNYQRYALRDKFLQKSKCSPCHYNYLNISNFVYTKGLKSYSVKQKDRSLIKLYIIIEWSDYIKNLSGINLQPTISDYISWKDSHTIDFVIALQIQICCPISTNLHRIIQFINTYLDKSVFRQLEGNKKQNDSKYFILNIALDKIYDQLFVIICELKQLASFRFTPQILIYYVLLTSYLLEFFVNRRPFPSQQRSFQPLSSNNLREYPKQYQNHSKAELLLQTIDLFQSQLKNSQISAEIMTWNLWLKWKIHVVIVQYFHPLPSFVFKYNYVSRLQQLITHYKNLIKYTAKSKYNKINQMFLQYFKANIAEGLINWIDNVQILESIYKFNNQNIKLLSLLKVEKNILDCNFQHKYFELLMKLDFKYKNKAICQAIVSYCRLLLTQDYRKIYLKNGLTKRIDLYNRYRILIASLDEDNLIYLVRMLIQNFPKNKSLYPNILYLAIIQQRTEIFHQDLDLTWKIIAKLQLNLKYSSQFEVKIIKDFLLQGIIGNIIRIKLLRFSSVKVQQQKKIKIKRYFPANKYRMFIKETHPQGFLNRQIAFQHFCQFLRIKRTFADIEGLKNEFQLQVPLQLNKNIIFHKKIHYIQNTLQQYQKLFVTEPEEFLQQKNSKKTRAIMKSNVTQYVKLLYNLYIYSLTNLRRPIKTPGQIDGKNRAKIKMMRLLDTVYQLQKPPKKIRILVNFYSRILQNSKLKAISKEFAVELINNKVSKILRPGFFALNRQQFEQRYSLPDSKKLQLKTQQGLRKSYSQQKITNTAN